MSDEKPEPPKPDPQPSKPVKLERPEIERIQHSGNPDKTKHF